MMEIVFGESACGSLIMAQNYGKGEYRGGCVGVFIAHEDGRKPTAREIEEAQRRAEQSARLEWESAVPMGGSPADVYGLDMALSVGDISEEEPGEKRLEAGRKLLGVYPGDGMRDEAQALLQRAKDNLASVLRRAEAGEDMRIWYSSQPDELCGLHWLMDRLPLDQYKGRIYLVRLPQWEQAEGKSELRRLNSWGEVAPGEWHRYTRLQKEAPSALCRALAAKWRELRQENAPLRAVINGRLASVPETLYDSFIERELEAEGEEFREAVIVGRVLGKYQLGIGDGWIALRIEEMIRRGKLEAVSQPAEGMPIYHRTLRKL